jgi:hypothetical protein
MQDGDREREEGLAGLRSGESELGEPRYCRVLGRATLRGSAEECVPSSGVRWVKPPLLLATFPEVHDAYHGHTDANPIPDGRHDTQRHDVVIGAEDIVLLQREGALRDLVQTVEPTEE